MSGQACWGRLSVRDTEPDLAHAARRPDSVARHADHAGHARRPAVAAAGSPRRAQRRPSLASGRTRDVLDALRQHGALFRPDLATLTGRLPAEVDEALWDGVARGLVTADGFRAVRSLLRRGGAERYAPARGLRRGLRGSHRRSVRALVTAARAGRSAPTGTSWPRRSPSSSLPAGAWCSVTSPSGRAWLSHGAICCGRSGAWKRGGRSGAAGSSAGFSGEQYAHPDAIDVLKSVRKQHRAGEIVRISAADPLNLTGIVLPGPRVPGIAAQHRHLPRRRGG